MAEANAWVAPAFANGTPPLVVVIGLGLGFVLDAVERRSPTTRVLAIEPLPESLAYKSRPRDWSGWTSGGRLTVLEGPDFTGAAEAFRLLDSKAEAPSILVHPVLKREFPVPAARAYRLAESILLGAKANEEARRRFSGRYLLNTLANLPAISGEGDVAALFGLFRGLPGVVVAPGPSLDATLEGLRRLQDRVLLIAVDTALRPLLAAGLCPHVVVSVDPQEANARHLLGLEGVSDTWLVAEGSLDTRAFDAFNGRTFGFKVSDHQPWPWLREAGLDRGKLDAWGSVLTTAFDLASRAGCDPIVFAGADLAFTNGLLYCRNSIYEPDWRPYTTDAERADAFRDYVRERATAKTVNTRGEDAWTTPLFLQFRDWLVSRSLTLGDRRVLNATGDGVLCGGRIVQTTLSAVEAGLQDEPPPPLRERLSLAWSRSSGSEDGGRTRDLRRARLHEAIARVLTAGRDAALLEAFRRFTDDTVTTASCMRALHLALPEDEQVRWPAGFPEAQ